MTTLPAGIPDKLTLRDISCRAVRVPLVFTLGTSAAIVRAVPLLLVDLVHRGRTGGAHLSLLLYGFGGPCDRGAYP